MTLFERHSELTYLTKAAFANVVTRLESTHTKGEICGLVFYPSSGYRDLGIAFATSADLQRNHVSGDLSLDPKLLEMLKDHPDLQQKLASKTPSSNVEQVHACEWNGASKFHDLFDELNDIIHLEYDPTYDAGFDNRQICEFFEELLTSVLLEAQSLKLMNGEVFSDDVLTGVQFPDTSNSETVLRLSQQVNSASWHQRLCAAYGK